MRPILVLTDPTAASAHLLLISALTAAVVAEGSAGHSTEAVDAVTLYTDGSWLDQLIGRLESFPLYRAERSSSSRCRSRCSCSADGSSAPECSNFTGGAYAGG